MINAREIEVARDVVGMALVIQRADHCACGAEQYSRGEVLGPLGRQPVKSSQRLEQSARGFLSQAESFGLGRESSGLGSYIGQVKAKVGGGALPD